jgi:hypothetical protein
MTDVLEQTINDRDGVEEIWGSAPVLSTPIRGPVNASRSEEIWGPALRRTAADPLPPAPESIWGRQADMAWNDRSPRSLQQPFALPAAWAASPRSPRWRERIRWYVRLSRRTGWSRLARTGLPVRAVRPPAGVAGLRGS